MESASFTNQNQRGKKAATRSNAQGIAVAARSLFFMKFGLASLTASDRNNLNFEIKMAKQLAAQNYNGKVSGWIRHKYVFELEIYIVQLYKYLVSFKRPALLTASDKKIECRNK